jgi:hypothetical protein
MEARQLQRILLDGLPDHRAIDMLQAGGPQRIQLPQHGIHEGQVVQDRLSVRELFG